MVYLTIDPSEAGIPPQESILLCIESYRTWSLLLKYNLTLDTYSSIYPVLMRLLLYFVNNVNIDEASNPFDCDVGAWLLTVLKAVLGSSLPWQEVKDLYAPVETCVRKWMTQLSRSNTAVSKAAHNMLAASIAFIATYVNKIKTKDEEFLNWKNASGSSLKGAVATFMTSGI